MSNSLLDMIFKLEKRILLLEKKAGISVTKDELTHPKAASHFEEALKKKQKNEVKS